jgi:hypothetical protein
MNPLNGNWILNMPDERIIFPWDQQRSLYHQPWFPLIDSSTPFPWTWIRDFFSVALPLFSMALVIAYVSVQLFRMMPHQRKLFNLTSFTNKLL